MSHIGPYVVYTDGGSRGNPGPASWGTWHERTNQEFGGSLGVATNNVAEYTAVIYALTKCLELGQREVEIRSDSALVVNQAMRKWKIKSESCGALCVQVWDLVSKFDKVVFTHVRREFNKRADAVCNRVLDELSRVV